jgi:hypothetical protein
MFGQAAVRAGMPAMLVSGALVDWEQRPTLAATARMYFRYAQGSGHSRDRRLLGRDLSRAVAYLGLGAVAVRGGRVARAAGGAAGAAYLALPVVRVVRGRAGGGPAVRVSATAAVPVVTVLRDLAKAAGAVHGLLHRRRRP